MKLQNYLDENNISVPEFAKELRIKAAATVYRYVAGIRIPDPEMMSRIYKVTGGKVAPNDFHDLPLPRPKPPRPRSHPSA